MQFGVAGATGDIRKLRLAEANAAIQVAYFVADAQFAKAIESAADIQTDIGEFLPVNHQRIGILKDLELTVAGRCVRSDKPFADGGEWSVELTGDSVGISEANVGAPFRAVPSDIHKCQPSSLGEGDVGGFRAVHFR